MPCNSDHLEPSRYELESKRAAQCFVYLESKMGRLPTKWIEESANNIYGSPNRINELTVELCNLCKKAPDSIIYNGKDPKARKLADWWDEHQEVDRRRIEKEKEDAYKQRIKEKAIAKLSDEEQKILTLS